MNTNRQGKGLFVRIAVAAVIPLALLAFAFLLPAQYSQTYLAALPLKMDALQGSASPRIVVAGGSGAAFNTRCDLVEQAFPGTSAVNLGLYAGLGTTAMLDLTLPHLREGDILVFSPELSAQTLSTFFHGESFWQAVDGRFDLLTGALGLDGGQLAGSFPAFAAAKARLFFTGAAPAGEGIYARASFENNGDLRPGLRPGNRMPGGVDGNMRIVPQALVPDQAFADKVNAVYAQCAARGVRMVFRLCAANSLAVSEEALQGAALFDQALRQALRCPVLGSLEEALLAPEWFYDTNYHLNDAGSVVDTLHFIAQLKAEVGDTWEWTGEWPQPPALMAAQEDPGKTVQTEDFVLQVFSAEAHVTAITDAARQKKTLVLPDAWEGVPLTAFAAEVFAGHSTLETLQIPASVRILPDRAFAGCGALQWIVLRQERPEECTVGGGLLEGTGAMIAGPEARLNPSSTNYCRARYATRIRARQQVPSLPTATPSAATAAPPAQARGTVRYEGNGGVLRYAEEEDSLTQPMDENHIRFNTLQGSAYFVRPGYVLLGWNTHPDGTGAFVGLGSRTERRKGLVLYAQWAQASPMECFTWQEASSGAVITGYTGGSVCVVPEQLGDKKVTALAAGAFAGCTLDTLVLPPSLRRVEDGCFAGAALKEMWLFDSLTAIDDAAFAGCDGPRTLHINANTTPVYCGTYYAAYADKYDWLLSVANQPKLVLFSGSSGRYGYQSPLFAEAFPAWQPVNMGVYAYTNAKPLAELLLPWMGEGDVLLSAPEFDAAAEQFCASDRLDYHLFAMMEANYDALATLDITHFSGVFSAYSAYQRIRSGMSGSSYTLSPGHFDDDGVFYPQSTYNRYGDFILLRENSPQDVRLRSNIADYTVDCVPPAYIQSLNAVYRLFMDRGVQVYFTYSPRNRSSLTERSTLEARAALHEHLKQNLCVPVISDIESSLLSGVYFWKIDSHPSTQGAEIHTRRVIEALRAWGLGK